ncbi:5222_t:CDS:1, partial [Racocetra persica]
MTCIRAYAQSTDRKTAKRAIMCPRQQDIENVKIDAVIQDSCGNPNA